MALEVASAVDQPAVECPHCHKTILVPLPDDPVREQLIGDYAAGLQVVQKAQPASFSSTLLGAMKTVLGAFRNPDTNEPDQGARRQAIQAFHEVLLHGLNRPGFRLLEEAQRIGLDRKDVGAAVKDVYREFFRKCIEDGLLSSIEHEAMAVVAQRLCLHPAKKAELESEVVGQLLQQRFQVMAQDGRLDAKEQESSRALVRALGMEWSDVVRAAREAGIALVERRFAFARADGVITREEADEIRRLVRFFELSGRDVDYIEGQLNELRLLSAYQEGSLPVVDTPASAEGLDGDEICHVLEQVWRVVPLAPEQAARCGTKTGVERVGLLLTRRRVRLQARPAIDFALSTLDSVREEFVQVWQDGGVRSRRFLVLRRAGERDGERVACHQHERLRAQLQGAWKNARPGATGASTVPLAGTVTAGVRTRVWVRDQGRCSHCGSTTELDFEPTGGGGATDDAESFRLACRKCRS